MAAKRTCRVCGKLFEDKTGMGRITLCSDACRKINHKAVCAKKAKEMRDKLPKRIWILDKICRACGANFYDDSVSHNRVRCHHCTTINADTPEHTRDKICPICGKAFVDTSRYNRAMMCSNECKNIRREKVAYNKQACIEERCSWCGGTVTGDAVNHAGRPICNACVKDQARLEYELFVEAHKSIEFPRARLQSTLNGRLYGVAR